MVVALVALCLAMAGSAAALPGKNSVNSGDVVNGSIKGADLGSSVLVYVNSNNPLPPNHDGAATQDCPQGDEALGGGYVLREGEKPGSLIPIASLPQTPETGVPNGWIVQATNTGTTTANLDVWVVCGDLD